MVTLTVLCSALLASVVVAQNPSGPPGPPNTTFSDADVQTVIGEVEQDTRTSWCVSQQDVCGDLCAGDTENNLCNPETLTVNCTCTSNSSTPALEYYRNTVIWWECTTLNGDCMAANAMSRAEQIRCNSTYICGDISAQSASDAGNSDDSGDDSGDDSASTSATPSDSPSETASETTAATSSTPSDGAAFALRVGEHYGAGILSAVVFGVMAFAF